MTQHAAMTAERWARFPRDRQLLMIANEMNRATRLMTHSDRDSRNMAYERVLRLADLTVEVNRHRPLRRELLRWRDLVAVLYRDPEPDPVAHRAALRCLLEMSPAGATQIPYLLGEA